MSTAEELDHPGKGKRSAMGEGEPSRRKETEVKTRSDFSSLVKVKERTNERK
jgi:hypothetical protein